MHSDTEAVPTTTTQRKITGYLLLTVTYVVSGKLGLILALPPGYASAIFPPAGIAVAAMLIGGRGVLPWVFLGSLLLNVWTGYSATHHPTLLTYASATIIALASMIQAAVGGAWLRRLVGYPTRLDNGTDLLRFFGSAPIICLISATLSTTGLAALGVFNLERLATNWTTWWIGDTLGVLVMLPLVMVMVGQPRQLWRRRGLTVALPMALAFVLFVLLFIRVNSWERDDSLLVYRLQSQQLLDEFHTQLEVQSSLLEQMNGLITSSTEVTRQEFHHFVQKPLTRFPMLQALEWVPRVEYSQRKAFEQAQRHDFPNFEIREKNSAGVLERAAPRRFYYPVTYMEPYIGNEPALGYDLASSPNRLAALQKAITTGSVVATAPLRLAQREGKKRTGVLLLLPVKQKGKVTGFVLSVLEMHSFVEKLLPKANTNLFIQLKDLDSDQILYDTIPSQIDTTVESKIVNFGTRSYRLETTPTPFYLLHHQGWQSWGTLVTGLLGTGLLGALLLFGTGHSAHLEREISERTARLKRSEGQLKEAQHLAHIGSWELDLKKKQLVWSDEIYRICELDPHNFDASYEAFLNLVHPDDRLLVDSSYTESLANHTPYEIEHRLRLPDGRIKHVREHCETYYDEQGDALRSVGAIQDITEQKIVEEAQIRSAEEVEDLYNNAPCGYHSLDPSGYFIRVNDTELKWLGYRREEVIRKMHVTDLFTPDSKRLFQEAFPRFIEMGHVEDLEFEVIRKDGTRFTALINASVVLDEAGNYMKSRSTMFDITSRKRIEQQLKDSEARFRNTLEYAPIGICLVSLSGQFIQVNRAMCDIVGYSKEEMESMSFQTITHPDDLSLDLANVGHLLSGEINVYQMEKRYIRRDGQSVWVQLTATLMRNNKNEPQYFISQAEDITERKRSIEQIRQLAYYDTLTGLANRRLMLDRFEHALDQAKRYQRSMAVMYLDLDKFKQINDTLGHDVGDELLKAVAGRISACVRHGDTVSRQGGDEFVIILTEIAHSHDAAQVAEKIIDALTQSISLQSHELRITTSIGIAVYPIDGSDDMLELMKKADKAMYIAKESGRNQYKFYQDE